MKTIPKLEKARQKLDIVDNKILDLLAERKKIIKEIAKVKKQHGLAVHQPARYKQLVEALQKRAVKLGLEPKLVLEIWDSIHEDSKNQQSKKLM